VEQDKPVYWLPMATSSNHRRRILYTGHVQGVGFRWTVKNISQTFTVTGFVKNLDDGRVELVAEGEPGDVDRFLAAVTERLGHFVANTLASTSAATGEFATFEIVH
jgi:acylphosphatase